MAKLIKILTASLGGGLVLGAGIRLGEAIVLRTPAVNTNSDRKLAERLSKLEGRLHGLESADPAASKPPSREDPTPPSHSEIRGWLEEAVAVRMSDVETRLRTESDRGRKQILDAVADQIQARLIERISKLEEDVADQAAAMSELRECSLRTEKSIQKLLGGLDKLIVRHLSAHAEGTNPTPGSDPGQESDKPTPGQP